MATKKSDGAPSKGGSSGKKKRPAGHRRPKQEVVVVRKTGTGVYVLLGIIAVIGVFVGTLLALDLSDRSSTTGQGTQGATADGQEQPSTAELEQSLAQNPTNAELRLFLAHRYFDEQQFEKAEEQYQSTLDSDPNNSEALNHMGLIRAAQDQMEEGLELIDRSIAQNPTEKTHVLFDRANLLTIMERHEDAIGAWGDFAELPNVKGTSDENTALQRIQEARSALESQ